MEARPRSPQVLFEGRGAPRFLRSGSRSPGASRISQRGCGAMSPAVAWSQRKPRQRHLGAVVHQSKQSVARNVPRHDVIGGRSAWLIGVPDGGRCCTARSITE